MKVYAQILFAVFTMTVGLMLFFPIISNHKLYFTYNSVEPLEQKHYVGETSIKMVSNRTFRRTGYTIHFLDVLRCNGSVSDREWRAQMTSSAPVTEESREIGGWEFIPDNGRPLPQEPSLCFMEIEIKRNVFGFIPARQVIVSGPIEFTYAD